VLYVGQKWLKFCHLCSTFFAIVHLILDLIFARHNTHLAWHSAPAPLLWDGIDAGVQASIRIGLLLIFREVVGRLFRIAKSSACSASWCLSFMIWAACSLHTYWYWIFYQSPSASCRVATHRFLVVVQLLQYQHVQLQGFGFKFRGDGSCGSFGLSYSPW
jgi:hypothetical protein